MENHKAFWGIPKQSSLTSEYLVTSEVEVVDGYGRLQVGETITTISQPDDGASCGIQLNTGTPQFIVSSTAVDKNIVSSCNCQPPTAYLLEYLVEGKDTYLPNLNKCWKDDEIKSGKKCKVWRDAPDDNIAEHNERRRIYRNLREQQTEKSE